MFSTVVPACTGGEKSIVFLIVFLSRLTVGTTVERTIKKKRLLHSKSLSSASVRN